MRLFLAIFLCLPIMISAQTESAADLYGAGVRAYYAGDYQTALTKYSAALAMKPNTVGYLYSRGLTYRKLDRDSLAERDFRLLNKLEPKYLDAWYQLGMLQMDRRQYDSAYYTFSAALRISPEDIKSLHEVGLIEYYRHKYPDAIATYNKIIAIKPDDDQAYYKRGLAKFNEDEFQDAALDFTESYRINPENTLALEQRALSYLRNNDLDHACQDWNILLKKGNTRVAADLNTYCGKN